MEPVTVKIEHEQEEEINFSIGGNIFINNDVSVKEEPVAMASGMKYCTDEYKGDEAQQQKDFWSNFKSQNVTFKCEIAGKIAKKFKCDICDYATNHNYKFEDHFSTHDYFECGLCHYGANSAISLKTHYLTHGVSVFKCDTCDFVTKHKRCWTKHLSTHKHFKCDICDYKTNAKEDFKQHLLTHKICEEFRCANCNFVTKSKGALKRHLLNHKKFRCGICNYETNINCNFNQHFLKYKFKCDLKNKIFEDFSKCTNCDYATFSRAKFKLHVITHKICQKLECDQCDYTTITKRNLKRHHITHNSSKEFRCANCNFETRNKRALKRHLLEHNISKDFKCDIGDDAQIVNTVCDTIL